MTPPPDRRNSRTPNASSADPEMALGPEDAGALRIGPTENGMVRLIVATPSETVELDFSPEDAREIADELLAAASICEQAPKPRQRG